MNSQQNNKAAKEIGQNGEKYIAAKSNGARI
jgi:hypothetical protein